METTLFDKINNIISHLPENLTPEKLSFISDTIMMLIRNESRYISRKKVGKYYGGLATLNPNDLKSYTYSGAYPFTLRDDSIRPERA